MKKIFSPIVRTFVKTAPGWSVSKALLRFTEWLRFERSKIERETAETKLQGLFSGLTVTEGYFKGLKYPGFSSFGSSLFPKLAGNYESELFPFFRSIEKNQYQSIIDIGCAEGFYAAALAIKFPASKIFAFDIDEQARKLCTELCSLNGVAARVDVLGECTPQLIESMNKNSRNLIICDCEGFERHLFNASNIAALDKTDLVIELHPMYEKDVKEFLSSLFAATHHIAYISSYDDNRKIFDLKQPYNALTVLEKLILVQEGRAFSMDWLIATAKR